MGRLAIGRSHSTASSADSTRDSRRSGKQPHIKIYMYRTTTKTVITEFTVYGSSPAGDNDRPTWTAKSRGHADAGHWNNKDDAPTRVRRDDRHHEARNRKNAHNALPKAHVGGEIGKLNNDR